MIHRLVHELAEDADLRVDVTVACRALRVSKSGHHGWLGRAPSARQVADEQLSTTITEVHSASRGTYGAPRVHAELRLGLGVCGRERVARLMRAAGLAGVSLHPDHQRRRAIGSALVRAAAVEAARAGYTWISGRTGPPTATSAGSGSPTLHCCTSSSWSRDDDGGNRLAVRLQEDPLRYELGDPPTQPRARWRVSMATSAPSEPAKETSLPGSRSR